MPDRLFFFLDVLTPQILEPAAGLEVFHTFTLIHDDIMDRSPFAAAIHTVWKKWNEDTAILSGDVMFIDAYKRIAKAPAARPAAGAGTLFPDGRRGLRRAAVGHGFRAGTEVPMQEYMQMIGLKTGVLIACAAQMGALIAGASRAGQRCLLRLWLSPGPCLPGGRRLPGRLRRREGVRQTHRRRHRQRQEELADRTRALEKAPRTRPLSRRLAPPADTPEQKAAKIAAVKEIYLACGVDADAKAEIVRFTDRALEAVSGIGFGPLKTEVLRRFAEKLVGRAK